MSWLNDRQYNIEKLALEYNKTLINEMKSACFPHPPRGYSRSDLLPAYLFALKRYYESLKRENQKKLVINLHDRNYKRFITKVINIFYAIAIVKRQEKLNSENDIRPVDPPMIVRREPFKYGRFSLKV